MGEVLPDLGEVPGEKFQGHEQAWRQNGTGGKSKRWTQVVDGSKQRGQPRGANRRGARSPLTLAFVLDLLRGDDFVEDGGERLVFSDDSGRDERGHDELPLTDVGFHGDPGRETMGGWARWKSQTEVFIHTLIISRT